MFQFNYLPSGLTASSRIFQSVISRIIDNIPGVICYQDDILIMTNDDFSHNQILRIVLNKLKCACLRLNKSKCKFFTDKVEYLGYVFDRSGVQSSASKISVIVNAPAPTDIKQVQSLIGLCNFYSRFIHQFATKMQPFYPLIQKNAKFEGTELHQNAFEQIKQDFASNDVLQHFNPTLETCIETDSSSYGVGVVLLKRLKQSYLWLPVEFAGRRLNSAERNYSQLEREALSVIFGVDKFKIYLLGSHFIIKNDHKPLYNLLGKYKEVPNTCSARVLHWALKLNQFDYEFQFLSEKDNLIMNFNFCLKKIMSKVTF